MLREEQIGILREEQFYKQALPGAPKEASVIWLGHTLAVSLLAGETQ